MFEKQIQKIKSMAKKEKDQDNKKKIENLVVFLIILIITIIAINTIWNNDENNTTNEQDMYKQLATNVDNPITNSNKLELEERLEQILRKIEGVGSIDVLITYSETSQTIAMYNEDTKESSTEETDTSGGIRKITETDVSKEVIYTEENGEKIPVTQKTIMPKIEGAIITARRGWRCNSKSKYHSSCGSRNRFANT